MLMLHQFCLKSCFILLIFLFSITLDELSKRCPLFRVRRIESHFLRVALRYPLFTSRHNSQDIYNVSLYIIRTLFSFSHFCESSKISFVNIWTLKTLFSCFCNLIIPGKVRCQREIFQSIDTVVSLGMLVQIGVYSL